MEPSKSTKDRNGKQEVGGQRSENETGQRISTKQRHFVYDSLPSWEMTVYLISCALLIWYPFYSLYLYSEENVSELEYNLVTGWKIFNGRLQDQSDYEWINLKQIVSPSVVLLLLCYILAGRAVEVFIPEYREHFSVIACLGTMLHILQWKLFLALLMQTIFGYLLSRTKRAVIIWLFSVFHLCSLNFIFFLDMQAHIFDQGEMDMFVFYTCFCVVKYTSFALECTQEETLPLHPKTKKKQNSFWDLMVYMFYLPLYLIGPILTYDKFRKQMNEPVKQLNKQRLTGILRELSHYIFWMLVIEVGLHFFYFSLLLTRLDIIEELPVSVLVGIAQSSTVFFQMKYMVIYGIPRAIALFDGIDAPYPPMCVVSMHSFRDMWRYFDGGFHYFLVRYIYIPLGGSQSGVLWKALASGVTFAYVCFWHGAMRHVFLWAVCNCLGLFVEILSEVIGKAGLNDKMQNLFSGSQYRRVMGVIIIPQFAALGLANLVFLEGTEVAGIQLDRLVLSVFAGEWKPIACVALFFYSTVQILMEAYRIWGKEFLCKKQYYIMKDQTKQS